MDLTEAGNNERLAAAVRERWGKLDMLVLNAAMLGTLSPVPVIDPAEFNRVLTLNLLAQQALIAAFDGLLRASDAIRNPGRPFKATVTLTEFENGVEEEEELRDANGNTITKTDTSASLSNHTHQRTSLSVLLLMTVLS